MRLLNARTLELSFFVGDVPEYAILSHRWEEEELVFEDLVKDPISNPDSLVRKKQGFSKVQGTCALAARDGFEWVWIDSCCIDKSSSSELQEAINSMFAWYEKAYICYAYLSDVTDEAAGWNKRFQQSKWFTRGWTLQELLAPQAVEFYAADWSPIGSRLSRYEELAEITGIACKALFHPWSKVERTFVAAQKLSWAAHRLVSRAEDEAYSLLGLFDVNIPMLYGEGRDKAFSRLQEAIYQLDADHSLFLFRYTMWPGPPLFASSATQFCQLPDCNHCAQYPQLYPVHVPYSQLEVRPPVLHHHNRGEDNYFVRFSRRRSIVKLPLIPYEDAKEDIKPLGGSINISHHYLFAALNIGSQGQYPYFLGLPVEVVDSSTYMRSVHNPVQLPPTSISKLNLKTHLISVISGRLSSRSQKEVMLFEIRSRSFRIMSWKIDHGTGGTTTTTEPTTQISNSKGKWTPCCVTLQVSNTQVSDLQVLCTLKLLSGPSGGHWNRESFEISDNLEIEKVEITSLSGSANITWVKPISSARRLSCWDRLILPLPDKSILHVALRRLAGQEQETSADKLGARYLRARYQVELEYTKGDSTSSSSIEE